MKCIRTPYFSSQIDSLQKKYRRIQSDIDDFCIQETLDPSWKELWNSFYKFRVKNSSIPTGKRWGFRVIAKVHGETIYPFIIYAKTIKENVTIEEIEDAYEKMIKEL